MRRVRKNKITREKPRGASPGFGDLAQSSGCVSVKCGKSMRRRAFVGRTPPQGSAQFKSRADPAAQYFSGGQGRPPKNRGAFRESKIPYEAEKPKITFRLLDPRKRNLQPILAKELEKFSKILVIRRKRRTSNLRTYDSVPSGAQERRTVAVLSPAIVAWNLQTAIAVAFVCVAEPETKDHVESVIL